MSELLSTVRGAITLDIPTLVRFRDTEDVFRRGITILILVGLVLGAVEFAVGFIGSVVGPSAEAELAEMGQNFDRMLQFMPPEAAQAFEEQFLGNFKVGLEITAVQIAHRTVDEFLELRGIQGRQRQPADITIHSNHWG